MEAGKKSSLCSSCARQYIELSSQMTLEIDTLSLELRRHGESTDDIDESISDRSYDIKDMLNNYKYIKARYMTKEQSIANEEPSNIFFRSNYVTKQLLRIHTDENAAQMDEKAILSLRSRTRRASQWKLNASKISKVEEAI